MHYTPNNLKKYLRENKISRRELAEKLNVSKRAVDKWCAPWKSQDHRDMPARKWDKLIGKEKKMIKYNGKKLTPRQAAIVLVKSKLVYQDLHDIFDIPNSFPDATEREKNLIFSHIDKYYDRFYKLITK